MSSSATQNTVTLRLLHYNGIEAGRLLRHGLEFYIVLASTQPRVLEITLVQGVKILHGSHWRPIV